MSTHALTGIPDAVLDLTTAEVTDICNQHRAGLPVVLIAISFGIDVETVETVIAWAFDDEAA
jgi:hypothetical protein